MSETKHTPEDEIYTYAPCPECRDALSRIADKLEAWAEIHSHLSRHQVEGEESKRNAAIAENYIALAKIARAALRGEEK